MVCTEKGLERARKYREIHREELNAKSRAYYYKNIDKIRVHNASRQEQRRATTNAYYQKHKEKILKRTNANYHSHPEKNKEYEENRKDERIIRGQSTRKKYRTIIFQRLSDNEIKCSNHNCLVPGGCKDIRALQIDHIHGGGNLQWKKLGLADFQRYKYLVNLPVKELKKDYQVLCANCNWIKKYEKGEVNQHDKK